jgi:hypothetical protein
MSKYEQPLVISYGWTCPIHGYHQSQVMLASKPKSNQIIDQHLCTFQPQDPVYQTRLYGNLKLEVNKIITPPKLTEKTND